MLKLGTQNISGMYVGEQKIKKAFVGTELVFEDNPAYTVYFYAVDEEDSSKVLNSSSFTVNPGESVSVNPWDINGYNFVGWYDESGNLVSSGSSFSVTPTGDATYYLKYYEYCTLLVSASGFVSSELVVTINGEDYSVTRNADAQGNGAELHLRKNSVVTVKTKTIPSGYKFDKWGLVYANITSTADPYTFTLTRDVEILHGYLSKASRLPAGYTEVEYVKSTATVCIDTGITPNISSTKIESKWMLDQYNSNSNNPFFGGSISSGKYFVGSNSATVLSYRFQSATGGIKTKTVSNMVGREITINVNYSSKILTVDGSNVSMGTVNAPSGVLYLFSFGTYTNADYKFIGKCYFFKIYSGSTLVADFVPCKNPSGVAGMYDTVRKAFYTTPINTSGLTAGPAV